MPAFKLVRPLSIALSGATSISGNLVYPTATSFTLSGPASGTNGVPAMFTVTPDGPLAVDTVVTISAPNASLSSTTLTFLAGSSAAGTFTVTRSATGTSAVSITNNGGLTNSGTPISFATVASTLTASFSLTSASAGTKPFAVGFAFRAGDAVAGSIAVSGATAQVSVLSTWPGGSARWAVISGTVTIATPGTPVTVSVAAGTPSSGTNLTTADLSTALAGQPVSIGCGAFGTASWADPDWATPFKVWVSGHLMSSWIYRKPVGSDPVLTAWLEVRLWASGAVEVLPWIENGVASGVASIANKSATYTFTISGTQRFSGAIDLPAFCRTPLVSGAALSYWLGTDPDITVKHDVAYLMATEMVPTYGAVVTGGDPVAFLPATYTPLQQGQYPSTMGTAGADISIGILPEWDVVYLTSTNAAAWGALQRNAYSAGRYGIHTRDATTRAPIRFSQHPTRAAVGSSNNFASSADASTTGSYTPLRTGTAPALWANSHHPSVGYLAALVTGRFYHVETAQFAATVAYLVNNDDSSHRDGAKGLLRSYWDANQVRGAAWALRTLVQAAAISPNGDALQTEFLNSWSENISYYHARYIAQAHNPQGWVTPSYTTGDAVWHAQPWQQDFFTSAVGYGKALGLGLSSPQQTKLDAFFAWKAKSIVGRLGSAGQTEYLYRYMPQTFSVMAPHASGNFAAWANGTGPWYATWGALWDAQAAILPTHMGTKTIGDGSIQGFNGVDAGSYFANGIPALAYAVRFGVEDAAAALQRVQSASNWATFVSFTAGFPVWYVKPASNALAWPTWRTGMAVRTWLSVPGNTIDAINPRYIQALNPNYPNAGPWSGSQNVGPQSCVVDTWNGGQWVESERKYYCGPNGGHGDYAGNETYIWSADTGLWTMGKPPSGAIGYSQGINLNAHVAEAPYTTNGKYTDGRVRSYHSYNNFAVRRGKPWFFGGSVYPEGQGPNNRSRIWEWDAATNDWAERSAFTIDGLVNAGCVYDPKRDVIWYGGNPGASRYDPNTQTLVSGGVNLNAPTSNYAYLMRYDTVRDCLVSFASNADGQTQRFSVAKLSPSFTTGVRINAVGTPPPEPNRGSGVWGIAYDHDRDRYLVWWSGTTVYVLTPPAVGTDPTTGTWTWSSLTPASGSTNPGTPTPNGVYGRFWYSSTLRAVMVFNATTQRVHAFSLE